LRETIEESNTPGRKVAGAKPPRENKGRIQQTILGWDNMVRKEKLYHETRGIERAKTMNADKHTKKKGHHTAWGDLLWSQKEE